MSLAKFACVSAEAQSHVCDFSASQPVRKRWTVLSKMEKWKRNDQEAAVEVMIPTGRAGEVKKSKCHLVWGKHG